MAVPTHIKSSRQTNCHDKSLPESVCLNGVEATCLGVCNELGPHLWSASWVVNASTDQKFSGATGQMQLELTQNIQYHMEQRALTCVQGRDAHS